MEYQDNLRKRANNSILKGRQAVELSRNLKSEVKTQIVNTFNELEEIIREYEDEYIELTERYQIMVTTNKDMEQAAEERALDQILEELAGKFEEHTRQIDERLRVFQEQMAQQNMALKNQNGELFSGLDPGETQILVKYRKRTRNPNTEHVISASPILWRRMTEAGSVNIDLQRVVALDQSLLVQCTRCLAYGHGRRLCGEKEDLCSHCGDTHMKAKCAEWLASLPPSCRNCHMAKLEKSQHNAFCENCPVRKRWDDLARSAAAYR
ncbi:unnamed protein product [Euphydryas editha]|uniref:RING-type domain-containing protein n=1 Tax=Euphydryas editha TaxID=104508 RepID=A0AAU9VCY7_EUPED|nr:unnamed protein product [Euphydryas editha]